MKKVIFVLSLVCTIISAKAQIENPVHWKFSFEKTGVDEGNLVITANIDKGWHVYSQYIEEGGPIPTSFKFTPSANYKTIGKVTESPKPVTAFDPNFNMKIAWHEKQVVFKQKISIKKAGIVKGSVEFMVCNDQQCLPPTEEEFNIPVPGSSAGVASKNQNPLTEVTRKDSLTKRAALNANSLSAESDTVSSASKDVKPFRQKKTQAALEGSADESFWGIFIAGFLGGLAAFFMPCIYPMIPLTVSFFTKKAGSRSKGIQSAFIYGLSIILIYVALGLFITWVFGASALNEAASSATFNLIFFVILVIFAVSFLGAFDITLPSSLVNKMDAKSNNGGLIGLFFMAFTLSLVSFSCTGPIIGTLLVDAVSKGAYLGPAIGMFGFSAALAIPFTLFAIFPSWLKEMPKSGGWLNSVKVTLGFLELALAFKFLSNVDLAYHWDILGRDIFLVIWIVIFGLLGLYLLGKLKFSHDSEIKFISLPRLFFAGLALCLTVYMVPGLWGAPLQALSAWLPPQSMQEFNLSSSSSGKTESHGKKYSNLFHAPHGLDAFYDYEEGLAQAKQSKKPVLLDFTGWSCTNCRKMEASVWSNPEVLSRLKNDFILISLYVDDKTELPDQEKYISKFSGKKIKTIGQKWSDFEASMFGSNSQPLYVIIDNEGKKLVPQQAFNLDIKNYITFLDSGKAAFKEKYESD